MLCESIRIKCVPTKWEVPFTTAHVGDVCIGPSGDTAQYTSHRKSEAYLCFACTCFTYQQIVIPCYALTVYILCWPAISVTPQYEIPPVASSSIEQPNDNTSKVFLSSSKFNAVLDIIQSRYKLNLI